MTHKHIDQVRFNILDAHEYNLTSAKKFTFSSSAYVSIDCELLNPIYPSKNKLTRLDMYDINKITGSIHNTRMTISIRSTNFIYGNMDKDICCINDK